MSSATLAWAPARTHKTSGTRLPRGKAARYVPPSEARCARMVAATRVFLFAATALYLSIEIPFAARLVGLLSGHATQADVEAIERLGRFISGAALALALWGRLLPRWVHPRASFAAIALRLGFIGTLCVAGMMVGQRTLVDRIADGASPEWHRQALQGAVLRDAAIPATPKGEGALQALTGALPFAGMVSGDRFAALHLRDAAVRAYAASTFPNAAEYRTKVASPAVEAIRKAHADYADASKQIAETRAKAYPQLERSWAELQDTIARRRLNVNDPSTQRKIVEHVRSRGVFVLLDWHPYDRAGFMRAGLPNDSMLRSRLTQAFGPNDIPLGLPSLDAFAAQPAVQATLRKSLGLGESGPSLRPSLPLDGLSGQAHIEARKRFADRLVATLVSGQALPTDMTDRGRDAVRLAVASAFGIVLSALGAAVHLCKLTYYAGSFFPTRRPAQAAVAGAGIAAVAVIAIPLALAPKGDIPQPLSWAAGAHGILAPIGHALDRSPALSATETLVRMLPAR